MILYKNEAECCGCEACINICPKQAISMSVNNRGFLYPQIDDKKCIHCNRCVQVCSFQNKSVCEAELCEVYAVTNSNNIDIMASASGGVFAALARYVIDQKGVVFGCAWDSDILPIHIRIDSVDDLKRIQGSKYVQSKIGSSYKTVKTDLENGKMVLFSGTPCQCDGLRSFLNKDYKKLLCVEVICHGVPSAEFWRAYLDVLEKNLKGKIRNVQFRDKKRGWGALLHVTYQSKQGKIKHRYLSPEESYYYYYYWRGNLYRDSCYKCKYACRSRGSDFTIGDYWGIQDVHPQVDIFKGVSVLIVNTSKGKQILKNMRSYINCISSTFEFAARENEQLKESSKLQPFTEHLWNIYEKEGVEGLEQYYIRYYKANIIKGKIKRLIPLFLKDKIKKIRKFCKV